MKKRMSISVRLKLFATLKKRFPENREDVCLDQGTTVSDLLRVLDIPEKDAKLIFVNNVKVDYDHRLNDNDRVAIFPPVGGG